MKKMFLATAVLALGIAVNAQTSVAAQPVVTNNVTTNPFDDVAKMNTEKFDFGKILQGKPVEYYFEIFNKSDKPIVIESATATCGCTVPEVPKEPIAPGSSAKIKVTYNAAGMGAFTKPLNIKLAGVDVIKTVFITGEQLAQADYDNYVKQQKEKGKGKSKEKNKTK